MDDLLTEILFRFVKFTSDNDFSFSTFIFAIVGKYSARLLRAAFDTFIFPKLDKLTPLKLFSFLESMF